MIDISLHKFIDKISLFDNLSKSDLNDFLFEAKTKNYKKGETIFLEEDSASNLYIILSGLVKTYNVNKEGNEAVIDIAGPSSLINDVFLDQFQYNAVALELSYLLLIPRKKTKDFAKTNIGFAFNILVNQANKNKELTNQLAKLKLDDAKYKLGQFLLSLAFENGNKIRDIILKFDKVIIASYLGIKPETLSRALQKLKEDGEIAIHKNIITLTAQNSLCKYCNNEISSRCPHRTPNCY